MVMWYWSVAILFWQLSIDHIVNVQCKRCGLAKTRLRHPSLPFDSLPYPTRTICRRVRTYVCTLGQSRDNQTKRCWPYSISRGSLPRALCASGSPTIRSFNWQKVLFYCQTCQLSRFCLDSHDFFHFSHSFTRLQISHFFGTYFSEMKCYLVE